MVDKVKPLKIEEATGGTEINLFPTEADPTEDYVSVKGVALEASDNTTIHGDSGVMKFKDSEETTDATLRDIKKDKVSQDDTTPGYLEDKIVAGTDIQITTLNPGGNETLEIESTATPTFHFFADQLETPNNVNWAVNSFAKLSKDSNNSNIPVRRFDDTTEEGVGFFIEVPSGATNIILSFRSRAETAPASDKTVNLKLYVQEVPDNAAVEAWSSGTALTALTMPANEYFQYDSQTIALSTLSMVAGRSAVMELTRLGTGTLSGDWTLLELKVAFS